MPILCRFFVQETPSYLGLFLHLISWLLQLLSLAVSTGPKLWPFSPTSGTYDTCGTPETVSWTILTTLVAQNWLMRSEEVLQTSGSLGRIPMSSLSQWIWQSVRCISLHFLHWSVMLCACAGRVPLSLSHGGWLVAFVVSFLVGHPRRVEVVSLNETLKET